MGKRDYIVRNREIRNVDLRNPALTITGQFEDEEGNEYISYLVTLEVYKDGEKVGTIADRNVTIASGFWWLDKNNNT